MNKEEKIKQLRNLLRGNMASRDANERRNGKLDEVGEVYARDIEALTAAIQALETQGVAEPERPTTQGAEMLSDVLQLVADCVSDGRRENTTADGVVVRILPDLIHTALHNKCIGTRLETAALKEAEFCARCIANRHVYDDVCVLLGNLALLLIGWIDPDRAMEDDADDQA